MSTGNFLGRDKTLSSLHNMLEIARNYDHNTFENEKFNFNSSSHYLLDICQQLEQSNDSLNQILGDIKQTELNKLKNSLKETQTLDCKYILALKTFKNSLSNVLNNMDKLSEAINKQSRPGIIKMDFKYQKLACKFLADSCDDLIDFQNNVKIYEELINYLSNFNFNPNFFKHDLEFANLYERLKQSIDLLLCFHQRFDEKTKK